MSGDLQLEADLLKAIATVLMTLGRPEDAIPTIELMIGIYRELGNSLGLATATLGLGLACRRHDRPRALEHFREAHSLAVRANLPHEQASALNNIARTSAEMGEVDRALEAFAGSYDLLRATGGAVDTQLVSLSGLARNHQAKGDYMRALEATRTALALGQGRQFAWLGMVHLGRAHILRDLGELDGARQDLEIALGWPGFPAYNRPLLALARAELDPSYDLRGSLAEIEASRDGTIICQYRLIEAQRLPPEAALESLEGALWVATEQQLGGMQAALILRRSQALLRLGQPEAALAACLDAVERSRTCTLPIEAPELCLTHHRALEAVRAGNALEPLKSALVWLEDTVRYRVAPEYRQGFLERNPVNREVIDRARSTGLQSNLAALEPH